ncbi:hypothetical protein [Nonomuraea dietziae]|uniref:hypothetical protein n=1 Tax=Nonomuraea dietziae TaxID=65515 RepID=UPI0031CF7818
MSIRNADHFAAYRLDRHGNPVGAPHRFFYDLTGSANHRDAQIRHAITRLLHWAKRAGVAAVGIEDLDFTAEKSREKHGRKKRFRQLVSGIPTGKLKARLVSMAAERDVSIVAVDPAYTSMWGAQHWQKPMTAPRRKDHPSRCREHRDRTTRPRAPDPATDDTAPTTPERCCGASDRPGRSSCSGARGSPPPRHGMCTRCTTPDREHSRKAGDQRIHHRSGCAQCRAVGPRLTPDH